MNEKTEKIKAVFSGVKANWKTPPEGKFVPYREYADITLGIATNYSASSVISKFLSFSAGCYLMMYHYKLPYLAFSVISVLNMPFGYLWNILAWTVGDNLGFMKKKTEKKFYALYFAMIALGLLLICVDFSPVLDPQNRVVRYLNSLEGINASTIFKIVGTNIFVSGYGGARDIFWRKKLIPRFGRYKYSLYANFVPKAVMIVLIGWLPFYSTIGNVATRVWVANLLFGLYGVFPFDNKLEQCAQNVSPDPQERIWVRTFPIKLSHFVWNIVDILIPVIVGFCRNKWENIALFKYILPSVFIVFGGLSLITATRVKERIPQPPLDKKVNIGFWDGISGVMYNKYKWIQTIVGLLDSLGNGMLAFTTILYLYTFRLSGLPYSLIVTLVSFCGTPPDFFTPYFRKHFTYRQVMIFYQLVRAVSNTVIVLCYIFFGDNLTLCGTLSIIALMAAEVCSTVPKSINTDMEIQISDYQMYLSGERLENFSGIFGWFTGPVTGIVGLIIPVLLLKFGFNSNWDVLFVDESRIKIIVIPIIIDIVGYLLMTVPYIFWDYDDVKQNKVIQVLKRREEVLSKNSEETDKAVNGNG